jgi:hypothetical protein
VALDVGGMCGQAMCVRFRVTHWNLIANHFH